MPHAEAPPSAAEAEAETHEGANLDQLAKVFLLHTLMMAEHSCLDGNWKTAWKMMGIEAPPWQAWSSMDTAALKREHCRSRLADPAWVATVIADLKDEDFLMKRRGKPFQKEEAKH